MHAEAALPSFPSLRRSTVAVTAIGSGIVLHQGVLRLVLNGVIERTPTKRSIERSNPFIAQHVGVLTHKQIQGNTGDMCRAYLHDIVGTNMR